MNRKLFNISGFIIVAALALTFAADGQAGLLDKLKRKKAAKKHDGVQQMTAGIYSGSLRGEIFIHGRKVLITNETMIYVIGQGARDGRSMVVTQRPVAATGKSVGGVLVAEMIVVRPDAKVTRLSAPSSDGRVTRGPNPNVGTINDGDFE
jgi:hypothetical protein